MLYDLLQSNITLYTVQLQRADSVRKEEGMFELFSRIYTRHRQMCEQYASEVNLEPIDV